MRYLITLQVSRYFFLALQGRIATLELLGDLRQVITHETQSGIIKLYALWLQ